MSIIAAFPFMILMVFVTAALLRTLRDEQPQQQLLSALLAERMQRMLEDYEARRLDE